MYYPRLRDLREDKDLTQNQLVEILQMHKTTYTNYEQGKREIPFSLAIRLAQFYDVSLDYIAGLTPDPLPLSHISRTTPPLEKEKANEKGRASLTHSPK